MGLLGNSESLCKRFFHSVPSVFKTFKRKDKGSSFLPAYQSCQLERDHKNLMWVYFGVPLLYPQAFFPGI